MSRTDAVVTFLAVNAHVLGPVCLAVGVLGAVAVVVLDRWLKAEEYVDAVAGEEG